MGEQQIRLRSFGSYTVTAYVDTLDDAMCWAESLGNTADRVDAYDGETRVAVYCRSREDDGMTWFAADPG